MPSAAPSYRIAELTAALKPWRVVLVPTCSSTNDLASRMRREGRLYAPAVVVTPRQTAGRGRGGNKWKSDPGTLTATFVLPPDEASPPHHLPIVAGLAVRDAVASMLAGVSGGGAVGDVQIKWPNDVLVGGKKVAGLLCERVEGVDLVGVGLNVTTDIGALPADVRGRATSVELSGRRLTVSEALLAVAAQIRRATEPRAPFSAVLRRYDACHVLVGRRMEIRTSDTDVLRGTCQGLDAQGRLLLQTAAGTERVVSGVVLSWA